MDYIIPEADLNEVVRRMNAERLAEWQRYQAQQRDNFSESVPERKIVGPVKLDLIKPIKLSGIELVADDGVRRNQNEFFEYWRGREEEMASSGELLQRWKILKAMYERGGEDRILAEQEMAAFRRDFTQTWLIGDTRFIYNADYIGGRVIHHYGAKNQQLRNEISLEQIPVYRGTSVNNVVQEEHGRRTFLATMNDPEGSLENNIQALESISGKNRDQIKFWTATVDSRREYPTRAAGFGCNIDVFHVSGNDGIDIQGCSRGVKGAR